MTDYFEVHERDAAARLGEVRLADPVTTPAVVAPADDDPGRPGFQSGDSAVAATVADLVGAEPPRAGTQPEGPAGPHRILRDAGSLWTAERAVPDGDDGALTILPHRGFPGGTPTEVQEAFAPDVPDVDYPSAAVVSPDTAADHGADAYVLSNARKLAGHARAFVAALARTRSRLPADTALYLPGVATPRNVATLAAAGVDLVDDSLARVRGSQGRYLTVDDDRAVEDLAELPCACPACRGPREDFDREDCIEHNVSALVAALSTVRERIRAGRLRDYLEAQARHDQWLTATLRRFDDEYAHLEQRTPVLRRAEIAAASDDTIRRVEIQRFADRVTSRYRNRFSEPLVLVPCSARKPYSESQSHGQFQDAIQYRAHVVSMTSPIGVVPQELELTYPAQHYDAVVTGRWSATEIEFVTDVLAAYLRRNEYPRIVAHVPEEGYREICERAADRLDLDVEYTVEDHPTTTDSLANLASTLADELKYSKRTRQHNTIRAIADYQFGEGAGDAIFEDLRVESFYPKLRATSADGEQLAMLVPEYGVLAFTLAGARRWVESSAPTKRVEIDDFVPHGSVLAPGVVEASDDIRVGDEVVVEGPRAFAVGRAQMSGPEMVESTRGIASQVRHVEER